MQGVVVKVRSYGKLAHILGEERQVQLDAPCTVAELNFLLAADCPAAAEALANTRVRACVNDTIVADSHIVRPDDYIELLSPVSGG